MAQDGRRAAARVDTGGRVHIAVADAAGGDAHEHLARARLGETELLHDERLGELLENRCADAHAGNRIVCL